MKTYPDLRERHERYVSLEDGYGDIYQAGPVVQVHWTWTGLPARSTWTFPDDPVGRTEALDKFDELVDEWGFEQPRVWSFKEGEIPADDAAVLRPWPPPVPIKLPDGTETDDECC